MNVEKSGDRRCRRVIVTGAAGYIGSHVCLALLREGHGVVAVDDLSTGNREALSRVEKLAGRRLTAMYIADVRDRVALDACFQNNQISDVIHLAGRKAVGESVADPVGYMSTNLCGTVSLLQSMALHHVNRIVFSSSCTVYGNQPSEMMPLDETTPPAPANPYGRSKYAVECLLDDLCASSTEWQAMSLRYFNPIGADASGFIGEDQRGTPTNLMPFLMKVASGELEEVTIHGSDYPTPDGTCVRDYLHVSDVAQAHVLALAALEPGHAQINLATGVGTSVLAMVEAVSRSVGRRVPHRNGPRRSGDAETIFAHADLAKTRLGWAANRDLQTMCDDHWRWHSSNPSGYQAEHESVAPVPDAAEVDLRQPRVAIDLTYEHPHTQAR